jgi:hypothetical protein
MYEITTTDLGVGDILGLTIKSHKEGQNRLWV